MEETSDQIGERLRQAREGAGLGIDDVVSKARIPRSVVEALEAADFSVFASPTYAKSFLTQYSEFLNVDARLWLDALEPAPFITGDLLRHAGEAAHPGREGKIQHREASGKGWISAVMALALTCGLIYAAIKGYEHLEQRFGGEVELLKIKREDSPDSPGTMTSQSPPVAGPEENHTATPPEVDVAQPPPRAIIVR